LKVEIGQITLKRSSQLHQKTKNIKTKKKKSQKLKFNANYYTTTFF